MQWSLWSSVCDWHAEKSKRAAAVALKLEEERRAEDSARMAKARQHQAVHQNHKQAAKEVCHLLNQDCLLHESMLVQAACIVRCK